MDTPADPVATLRRRSQILARLLDEDGRVARWPKRYAQKLIVLEHLAAHFEPDTRMTEAQVNELLNSLHSFRDPAVLRRWLVEHHLLQRTRDGAAYWLVSTELAAR